MWVFAIKLQLIYRMVVALTYFDDTSCDRCLGLHARAMPPDSVASRICAANWLCAYSIPSKVHTFFTPSPLCLPITCTGDDDELVGSHVCRVGDLQRSVLVGLLRKGLVYTEVGQLVSVITCTVSEVHVLCTGVPGGDAVSVDSVLLWQEVSLHCAERLSIEATDSSWAGQLVFTPSTL